MLIACPALASSAAEPAGYYDDLDRTSPLNLKRTLHELIDDHVRLKYTQRLSTRGTLLDAPMRTQRGQGTCGLFIAMLRILVQLEVTRITIESTLGRRVTVFQRIIPRIIHIPISIICLPPTAHITLPVEIYLMALAIESAPRSRADVLALLER